VSRSLGRQLPDRLLARLFADPADRLAEAVVLVTVDPYGVPHPALVSYGTLLAVDASRLRLGLAKGTRSATHLRDSARAALLFADTELQLCVKVDAVSLPAAPSCPELVRFELHVRDVLEDRAEGEEAGATLTSGISFALPGDPAAWVERTRRLRRALAE
jgi:hypothetical protein